LGTTGNAYERQTCKGDNRNKGLLTWLLSTIKRGWAQVPEDWIAIRLGARSLRTMAATERNGDLAAEMLAMAQQMEEHAAALEHRAKVALLN
jgi:hypothetical protein